MSLHFLYQALSFSFCVLTASVFNTWVADKMAQVPEKARKCLLNSGEPESRGSTQTTLIDGITMKCLIKQEKKKKIFRVNILHRHSLGHPSTQKVRAERLKL